MAGPGEPDGDRRPGRTAADHGDLDALVRHGSPPAPMSSGDPARVAAIA